MILVQNHRLQSSGNNFWFLWVLLPLLFSCGASRIVVENKEPIDVKPADGAAKKLNDPKKSIETATKSIVQAFDSISLAVYLPLNASSFEESAEVDPTKMEAIQFYWGVKAALDSVSRLSGLPASLKIIDSKSDTTTVFKTLQNTPPIFGATILWHKNEAFAWLNTKNERLEAHNQPIRFSTGAEEHMVSLFRYFKNNYYLFNPVLIQGNQKLEKTIANYVQKAAIALINDTIPSVHGSTASFQTILPKLKKGQPNIVFLVNSNEQEVANWCKALQNDADEYSITLVGLPNWERFSAIRAEWFDNLRVTITQSFWYNIQEPYALALRKSFRDKLTHEPGEEFIKGYDVGRAVCQWIFDGNVGIAPINGIALPIWIPEWKRKEPIWNNEAVNILRFDDLLFEKQKF